MERVVAHFRKGEYADAESICRNLLVQEPNDPDATHFLGLMRHYQGDDEEGIRLLERSVALVPGFVNYQANLAAVYRACSARQPTTHPPTYLRREPLQAHCLRVAQGQSAPAPR